MDSQHYVNHPNVLYNYFHILVKKENEEFSLCNENDDAALLFSSFDFTKQKKVSEFLPENFVCSGIITMDFNQKIISGFAIRNFLIDSNHKIFNDLKFIFEVAERGCFEVYTTASEGDMETDVIKILKKDGRFDIPDYLDTMICENYQEDDRHTGYYNTIPNDWNADSFYILNFSQPENLERFIKNLSPEEYKKLLSWSRQAESVTHLLLLPEEKEMVEVLNQCFNQFELQKTLMSSAFPNFKKRF